MNLLDGIGTIEFGVGSVAGVIKLFFLVIAVGYLFYAFLLTLRVRILADTVKTPNNGTAKLVSYAHLIFAVIGSGVAVILILLG